MNMTSESTMKAFLLVLPAALLLARAEGRCDELNSAAAALRGGDSCRLFDSVLSEGDVLAGDPGDVDLTCGVHLEGVEHRACVGEAAAVADGIADGGCEVTGG